MKKLFKYTYLALVGMVATLVASCSDSYKYDGRGTWDASDSYANIYFQITDSALELDPADPTEVTVKVSRRNTQGALTVPFEIKENTDDVFSVGEAVFADGASEAEFTVSFPKAEVGKPYKLSIMSSDPNVVSKYSAGAIYTIKVTRVKWNDVGFYYKDEAKTEKVEGYVIYTDDIITGFYGVPNEQYPVRIQERDDMKGYFRVIGLYNDYMGGIYSDQSMTTYLYINATDPTHVYIPEKMESNMDFGSGHILVFSKAGLRISQDRAKELTDADFGTYENGKITFPKGGLLIGEVDYNDGALYGTNNAGLTSLVINPDLDLHNADMTSDEDFSWELVNDKFMLVSGQLKTQKEGVALYKGTCINKEGKCDERFAKEYGTAYKIESPYAEGFDIFFAVNDKGEVTLPEELKYQKTGLDAVGTEVYALLSPAASTFTESVITLKMAFQSYPDEDGNYTEYGSAEEILQFITWTKVGTGMYTFTSVYGNYDPATEEVTPVTDGPFDLYQRDDDGTMFKITEWGEGGEFIFTWDGAETVTVPGSFTGTVVPDEGNLYVSDVPTYTEGYYGYEQYPCTFDAETNTFSWDVVYSTSVQIWGLDTETFKVTWDASSSRRAVATKSHRQAKHIKMHQNKMKNFSPFAKGKKTNVKAKRLLSPTSLVK